MGSLQTTHIREDNKINNLEQVVPDLIITNHISTVVAIIKVLSIWNLIQKSRNLNRSSINLLLINQNHQNLNIVNKMVDLCTVKIAAIWVKTSLKWIKYRLANQKRLKKNTNRFRTIIIKIWVLAKVEIKMMKVVAPHAVQAIWVNFQSEMVPQPRHNKFRAVVVMLFKRIRNPKLIYWYRLWVIIIKINWKNYLWCIMTLKSKINLSFQKTNLT